MHQKFDITLSVLPLKDREDYILKLLYLSDLRKLYTKIKLEVEKMPITIDLEDSEIYKEAVEKGQRKGCLRALKECLNSNLVSMDLG
ncbi:hypothetical protein [Candidatus Magnetomonas plexicatena]|uniref:hypothetical protein n=1 Tax=Candidatus Magnetomonas plexicatena TaxID=2552947 RepID=UPI00110497B0|nr:hypothetical protein E2O03_002195 [Nitrospirales bacterium LBB_01]